MQHFWRQWDLARDMVGGGIMGSFSASKAGVEFASSACGVSCSVPGSAASLLPLARLLQARSLSDLLSLSVLPRPKKRLLLPLGL
ncbi:hypothetical protein [Parasitella parasitica]|uniref:Uncharacterized protein n=1 Tax=Parasitella parasitica TaxID=35722 RepID=A0A0B7NAA1_9FUNG|nr:hypothetical protein [Parasitella parasitica]